MYEQPQRRACPGCKRALIGSVVASKGHCYECERKRLVTATEPKDLASARERLGCEWCEQGKTCTRYVHRPSYSSPELQQQPTHQPRQPHDLYHVATYPSQGTDYQVTRNYYPSTSSPAGQQHIYNNSQPWCTDQYDNKWWYLGIDRYEIKRYADRYERRCYTQEIGTYGTLTNMGILYSIQAHGQVVQAVNFSFIGRIRVHPGKHHRVQPYFPVG